ncbi:MAG: hypothetical protein BWZ07_02706 [Alphaproteobacteria bacterium ADurb.BinA280]|jgi:hypothetical protein|nr:hypothetical protein [Aquimonas sp.]OPZ10347.1 MAG: hypothetical protein BWZ07_02706 [Alphaproteobacteria bacterium ADurb.BinA280]
MHCDNPHRTVIAATLLLLAGVVHAWPAESTHASKRMAGTPVATNCEDLSGEPIRYGLEYNIEGSGLPSTIIDIQDILLSGGCINCHQGSAPVGGLDLSNGGISGSQLIYMPSNSDPDLIRVMPGDPAASLLYAQLNCTPPAGYFTMPYNGGAQPPVRLPIAQRAAVYDWIAQGARGFNEDGQPYSLIIFRSNLESTR